LRVAGAITPVNRANRAFHVGAGADIDVEDVRAGIGRLPGGKDWAQAIRCEWPLAPRRTPHDEATGGPPASACLPEPAPLDLPATTCP
jgi:hypothetical protein